MKRLLHKSVLAAYLCSAAAALASYPLLLMYLTGHPLVAGMASGVVGGLVNWLRIRYLESLRNRAGNTSEIEWEIEVNAVKVGTISDAELAAMELGAFSDAGNYGAQLLNVFKVFAVSLEKVLVAIPFALFWGGVALAVFSPDQFSIVLASLQKSEPANIAAVARFTVQVFLPVWMVVLFAAWVSGSRFGFVNFFKADIARRLRRHCNTAADGSISIIRWTNGQPVFYRRKGAMRDANQPKHVNS